MKADHIKTKLNEIVDQAQLRINVEAAQNLALREAINMVEVFLKKMKRVCYGGQAINAYLPQKDQFYNPETSLPDYDFFSPDAKGDVDILIDTFKAAGYTEISKKIGIHEGTINLYINFTAIADITQMIPELYEKIYAKSQAINGIHYCDPIFLRMLIYLELSRPRGQVARWNKVYDRLQLLDKAEPLKACRGTIIENKEAEIARPALVRYMIKEKRVFMGADIHVLYTSGSKPNIFRTRFILNGRAPIVFFSPDAQLDANILADQINARKLNILGFQNILPAMIVLYSGESLVGVIVQEEACHSTVTLPLTKHRYLRIASVDTLITFLIGLYYRDDSLIMTQDAILCWLKHYIDLSDRFKAKPTKLFPAFSIECSGYETTFASLLRAKVARIEAARQKVSSGKNSTQSRRIYKNSMSPRRTRRRN